MPDYFKGSEERENKKGGGGGIKELPFMNKRATN